MVSLKFWTQFKFQYSVSLPPIFVLHNSIISKGSEVSHIKKISLNSLSDIISSPPSCEMFGSRFVLKKKRSPVRQWPHDWQEMQNICLIFTVIWKICKLIFFCRKSIQITLMIDFCSSMKSPWNALSLMYAKIEPHLSFEFTNPTVAKVRSLASHRFAYISLTLLSRVHHGHVSIRQRSPPCSSKLTYWSTRDSFFFARSLETVSYTHLTLPTTPYV